MSVLVWQGVGMSDSVCQCVGMLLCQCAIVVSVYLPSARSVKVLVSVSVSQCLSVSVSVSGRRYARCSALMCPYVTVLCQCVSVRVLR